MPLRVVMALGCWVAFLMRRSAAGVAIVDPAAESLVAAVSGAAPSRAVAALIERGLGLPAALRDDGEICHAFEAAAEMAFSGQLSFPDTLS